MAGSCQAGDGLDKRSVIKPIKFIRMKAIQYFILLICLSACGQTDTQRKSDAFKQERKAREIRRITDGQIQTAAYEEGKSLHTRLEGVLLSQMDSTNFDCQEANNIQFQSETLVSFKLYCEKNKEMNSKEMQLWEAYQKNIQQQLPVGDNLQKLDEATFLYSVPFYIGRQYKGIWSIVMSKREIIRKI
jgi:hypothetical protein